jgi:hypothetical protein
LGVCIMKHEQVLLALWRAAEDSLEGWATIPDLARALGWHELDVEHELNVLAGLKLVTAFGADWDNAGWLYCLTEAGLSRARELAAAVPGSQPERQNQAGRRGYGTPAEKGAAYREWRDMPNDSRPKLPDWLEAQFGTTAGILNVKPRTFQGWKKYTQKTRA